MNPSDSLQIAHETLCHCEPPFLKYYQRGRFRHQNGVSFTGSLLPGPGFNFAACTGVTPPLADVVAMAREFFVDPADAWGVLVAGDHGHPIEDELKTNGWTIAEHEPAYVLADPVTAIQQFKTEPSGLIVRPMLTEADCSAFSHITGQAYCAPPEFADLMMPSLAYALDPDMIWLLADWNGEPVATGGGYRVGSSGVICCLATLDAHRGRGFGAMIMHELMKRLVAAGSNHLVLRSGPKSRPLYERLGFKYVCQHRTYVPRVDS